MLNFLHNHKLTKAIVTVCGAGLSPIMPGTMGSIVAFPLMYLIDFFIVKLFFTKGIITTGGELITLLTYHLIVLILLFIIGTYYSSIYVKQNNIEDPKEVVIDEVVGQYFLVILTIPGAKVLSAKFHELFLVALMFILFRVYDIIKPWPISWFDRNIKGGIGVMLDDVIASIFGAVSFYLIMYIFI